MIGLSKRGGHHKARVSGEVSYHQGYALHDLDRYWFSRGGFSRQPNLYGFQIPYLWRGEVKHYLRALFNSFAVAFYPNTRMLTEHPLPTMSDWGGDHFKTSDGSIFCYCLRLTLLYERGKDLLLLYAAPREWFDDGKRISVREASAYFGKISFETESKVSDGFIRLRLNPPTRDPPDRVIVHLRHPEGLEIAEVLVNGEGWKDFDREKSLGFCVIWRARRKSWFTFRFGFAVERQMELTPRKTGDVADEL